MESDRSIRIDRPMAPSSQSTGPQEEEEVIALPEAEKDSDVLRRASVKRFLKGVVYYGTVEDMEQVKDSGERLYLIRYTDGDVEHLTADQVRELSYTADVGDEAQSWSGVLNKAEHAENKAGFVHDAPRVSVPYCRFAGSCWRPLCPYVHASSRTRERKWTELWAWIAANEGEADDAKHDKTVPSLLLQLDGVESKLRDEMSAQFDRDRCENDRVAGTMTNRQGLPSTGIVAKMTERMTRIATRSTVTTGIVARMTETQ